jgi:hypothetical protein
MVAWHLVEVVEMEIEVKREILLYPSINANQIPIKLVVLIIINYKRKKGKTIVHFS